MRKKLVCESKYFILDRPYERNITNALKHTSKKIKAIYYRLLLLLARKCSKDIEKEYNVCICAIFKNEANNLREWLEYHLIIGVEHFYLYNNNSTDKYREVLVSYIESGTVTLIDWPKQQAQMEAYQDAISNFGCKTKWLGFIDLDEYVVPLKERKIYEVLKQFNNKAPAVLIYWKCFGSSGLLQRKENELLIEQFTLAQRKIVDIGKCFWNTRFDFAGDLKGKNHCLHHWCWCKWRNHYIPPVNIQNKVVFDGYNVFHEKDLPIQINHYVTKSYEDYYNKTYFMSDVYFKENPRKIEQFYVIDSISTTPDFSIFRFIIELKHRIFVSVK